MSSFTNRHGKKTSVDGAVDEITATEAQMPSVPQVDKPTKNVATSKKNRQLRLPSKKATIIGLSVVLLLIISYGVAADTARRDFDRTANAMSRTVADIKAQSISEGASALDALNGLQQKLGAAQPCQSSMPDVIYAAYPPAQQSLNRCREVVGRYADLKTALDEMKMIASYLDAQSTAVANTLAAPADGAYAEVASYVIASQKALNDLKMIRNVPVQLTESHSKLMTSMDALSRAWSELASANDVQNAEGFTNAEKSLAAAYEAMRENGDAIDAIISSQQAKISAATGKF